jgi:AcrR family transcriptional regulator
MVTGTLLPIRVNDVNIPRVKRTIRPERAAYHHGDLRNALLEASVRLVAKQGPDGFSLREAAREVGVSPAAAYRHFPDKLHLLAVLAVDAHARLATHMEKALSKLEEPPGSREHAVRSLLAIGEAYVDFAVRHPEHFRVMFQGEVRGVEGFKPGAATSGRDAFQILLDTLDGLVTAKVITGEARVGAELSAWAGVHGLASLIASCALPLPARARPLAVWTVFRTTVRGLGAAAELVPPGQALSVDPREANKLCAK